MSKLNRKIHLWLALPFGIIIMLISFSGAMLAFEKEIKLLTMRHLYYVAQPHGEALPMDMLMETVAATLPDSVSITGVTVYADPERTYQVNLSKPHKAAVYVNQYTGEVAGRYERPAFFSFMFNLHRWLLDSYKPGSESTMWGRVIVGISTIAFALLIITGIIYWWPMARKHFWRSLRISAKPTRSMLWRTLHHAGGVYVGLLILVMALTGLTWSFGWYRTGFMALFGASQPAAEGGRGGRSGHGHGERHHSQFARWQEVYDQLRAARPDAPQITVGDGTASVNLSDYGNARAADKYEYSRRSGEVTLAQTYADSPRSSKMQGWIYAVHTGAFGGLLTKLLWFAAALFGSTLPVTGYYIWWKKGKKSS